MSFEKRDEVLDAISDFKLSRDAIVHADEDEFIHYLRLFIRQLEKNPFCHEIVSAFPKFDVDSWWKVTEEKLARQHKLDSLELELPDDRNEQMVIFLDLMQSFASEDKNKLSTRGFGRIFGKHKPSDGISLAQSMVIRPFAEEMTRRLRKSAELANPDVRELAGVPLNRIPTKDEVSIFLSHKWADKDMVRRYHATLRQLGYTPWLDEDIIVAGSTLHRELEKGMQGSCAAVFFITPAFRDERWLAQELDFAVNRLTEHGPKFQIITLVFEGASVPQPLKRYVYKSVVHELDGLREIIRAVPIELGPARWRENVANER